MTKREFAVVPIGALVWAHFGNSYQPAHVIDKNGPRALLRWLNYAGRWQTTWRHRRSIDLTQSTIRGRRQ